MSYSKENRLQRIIDIQRITREHTDKGVSQIYVYKNYIWPAYRISIATFYNYLSTPAARELKKIEQSGGARLPFCE